MQSLPPRRERPFEDRKSTRLRPMGKSNAEIPDEPWETSLYVRSRNPMSSAALGGRVSWASISSSLDHGSDPRARTHDWANSPSRRPHDVVLHGRRSSRTVFPRFRAGWAEPPAPHASESTVFYPGHDRQAVAGLGFSRERPCGVRARLPLGGVVQSRDGRWSLPLSSCRPSSGGPDGRRRVRRRGRRQARLRYQDDIYGVL
jgi:hypothetical protein